MLAGVPGQGRGALEFLGRPRVTAELGEKVATDAGKQMVALEGGFRTELIDEREAGGGAVGHRDRDRPVQLHDR